MKQSDFQQLSFQLIGRLLGAKAEMDEVRQYLSSVEQWTPRPYVKPVSGCFEGITAGVEEMYVGSGVTSIASLPNPRKVIAGLESGKVLLLNMGSAEIEKKFVGHSWKVTSVAVSRDGRCMVSCSRLGTVRRWDVKTGIGIEIPLTSFRYVVEAVAISDNGDLIAAGCSDGIVRLRGKKIGEPARIQIGEYRRQINSVAISSDGLRIVTGSSDKTVRVWDTLSGKQVMDALCGHSCLVTSVAISGNGQWIVSGSSDSSICIWDVPSGKKVRDKLHGHTDSVSSVAVSDDCRVVASASSDKTVQLWDMSQKNPRRRRIVLCGHKDSVTCTVLSNDGANVVSGSSDRTVRLWDLSGVKSGDHSDKKIQEEKISALSASPDGMVVVGRHEDGFLHVLDLEAEVVRRKPLLGHSGEWVVIAISKQHVVSALDGNQLRLCMWDVTTGKTVESTECLVLTAAFRHNCQWIRSDSSLNTRKGGTARLIRAAAISHDCQWIAFGFYLSRISLFEIKNGKEVREPLHIGNICCIMISYDDRFICCGMGDKKVRMWDIRSGKEIGTPLLHDCSVKSLYMSRDNQQVISIDCHNTARLWSIREGKLLESATKGLAFARLLLKAKNGWQVEEPVGKESSSKKPQVTVNAQNVYICESAEGESSLKKIGQFDVNVKDWAIDAKGTLWALLAGDRLATLKIVEK